LKANHNKDYSVVKTFSASPICGAFLFHPTLYLYFMKKRIVWSVAALLMLCNSVVAQYCIQNRFGEEAVFTDTQLTEINNVEYGSAFNPFTNQNQSLKLDLVMPSLSVDELNKRPLIVLIHGGAFLGGDKADMRPKAREYAKRGYACASISYRLGWNCLNNTLGLLCLCNDLAGMKRATYQAVQDARAALRFLSSQALTYRFDAENIILMGESAGAITALHTAFWSQSNADTFAPNAFAQLGGLNQSGNALDASYQIKAIVNSCGGMNKVSAITASNAIPVVSFHDQNDCVVPINVGFTINCTGNCYNYIQVDGSREVRNRLTELGVCTEINVIPEGVNHCSYPQNQLIARSSCFLKRLFCNECQSAELTSIQAPLPCSALGSPVSIQSPKLRVFSVYPQPVSQHFSFRWPALLDKQECEVNIYSISGQHISHQKVNAQAHELNCIFPDVSSGLYLVTLQTSDGLFSTLISKE
jgi:hypothetical protein